MIEFISSIFTLLVLGGVVVVANLALRERAFYILTIVGVLGLNALILLFAVALPFVETSEYDFENTTASAVIFVATAALTIPILFEPVRRAIGRWFPQRTAAPKRDTSSAPMVLPPVMSDGEIVNNPQLDIMAAPDVAQPQTNTSEQRGFDPRNPVHMLALVFSIYALGLQLGQFILIGGLEGVAETTEITYGAIWGNFLLFAGVALAGTGLFVRRSMPQFLERVGLARTSLESLIVGFVASIGMLIVLMILGAIWIALVGQETYEQQSEASQAISDNIDSIWIVLSVAVTAAIGEELLFRGALQPIFGLWWTAIFFVLVHPQYMFTPAVLILLVQAIVLGWLRQRYDLYAPIIAHFFYNFVQLLVALSL